MGIFTQRQAAYTPPLDGSPSRPTLVGGQLQTSPSPNPDEWRIELRRYPILHRGHAVLVLVGPDNTDIAELNGWAESRTTQQRMPIGIDGTKLVVERAPKFRKSAEWVADLASGPRAKINALWGRGVQAANEIEAQDFDYKAHDPSYELGSNGGQIQNSNSVAYTLTRAMGLDADSVLRNSKFARTFSGWGHDLLDPQYERYVVPPVLPNSRAP